MREPRELEKRILATKRFDLHSRGSFAQSCNIKKCCDFRLHSAYRAKERRERKELFFTLH